MITIISALLLLQGVQSFVVPSFRSSGSYRLHQAVDGAAPGGDPLQAIRDKMAADPNYNPMQDPQAMQALESRVPESLRDIANSIERTKVSFKDATEGSDANTFAELERLLSETPNRGELLSSPTSSFFKERQPDVTFDQSKADSLYEELKKEYPQVPEE